ncbi:short-chain dehydrogenase/reductase SDR [Segniliparus rotundus DSM 44985]|uniref:Short-chain dehydrogenase/reductase SDR n=1 Tax=Segniliparus rotundus (strain ATCC BAA-972 / CDC 1076 / CIP 108378 / DSM 44985 / JCM 13578) TaxID=640132 RepID=D6ZD62_SEGRD|nr:decaprenylphospho-beta-D-erythro-pentofuranosid-2-ulose 2-reductase [Segniliparus rotundus]ADG99249.1 short-chain dehydrogenase/reductase SDR [Segniliparus rotundus DSM 44985]
MMNAVGVPKSVLLLGGASEIALAIAEELLDSGPLVVTIAARDTPARAAAAKRLERHNATVRVVDFEATDFASHPKIMDAVFEAGDVDVSVVAFAVLGDAEENWQNQAKAVELAQVNYTAAVSVGVLLGEKIKTQGHGRVIALSTVAGERVRRANFVYGSSKAGFDGFYLCLGEALAEHGGKVTVVRPGQVRTKLSAGHPPAPLTVDAQDVAKAAVAGMRAGKEIVWVPWPFRFVMFAFRHIPRAIFRKLPV